MAVLPEAYKLTAVLYTVVVAVAFILNAGRLMLDKIGTLLKAQYRAENRKDRYVLMQTCTQLHEVSSGGMVICPQTQERMGM